MDSLTTGQNCILLVHPFAPYAPRGFAPLSVATVAGITPAEFHVDIWDELVRGPVRPELLPRQYRIVGISIMFPYQGPRAAQIAQEFREKGVLTVLGGAFPTSDPAPFRGRADVLIIGECEELWPRFLRDWLENRHQSEYRQITPPDLSHARRALRSWIRPDHTGLSVRLRVLRCNLHLWTEAAAQVDGDGRR
jgi:radical SAM superfamily enzyme YgiQ (UPF0313 family)